MGSGPCAHARKAGRDRDAVILIANAAGIESYVRSSVDTAMTRAMRSRGVAAEWSPVRRVINEGVGAQTREPIPGRFVGLPPQDEPFAGDLMDESGQESGVGGLSSIVVAGRPLQLDESALIYTGSWVPHQRGAGRRGGGRGVRPCGGA